MLSKLVEDIIGLSRQFTLAKTESIKFKWGAITNKYRRANDETVRTFVSDER
jgi:hypothetical protein